MPPIHAVGIDLGTTYSCIAYLNEHGEPVTLANAEGELATPSVVLFEGDEVIVGTQALRNAIVQPECVVQNAKRYMGRPDHRWTIAGRSYSPVDISAFILRSLLRAAEEKIGRIRHAVITVPAQFGEIEREATVRAAQQAGLEQVDLINEPVAAALCYVLGSEGLWFTELASEQRILVFDLGGGTFDLSLVRYSKESVQVIASGGDLELGGIDWNRALLETVARQFRSEFGSDPRDDPESLQLLTLEVEQTKRSLSVRPAAALVCQHAGHRKAYRIERAQFEKLTAPLVERTAEITKRLLRDNGMGWAHVDVVLTTGGATRMPMIRERLKQLSGRTINTSLSPDLSIAHGASYYAGMLLTNRDFAQSVLGAEAGRRLRRMRQVSVTGRSLGILIRDVEQNVRRPYYLIPANRPLPVSATETFGTVVPNQRRVHLHIIESAASDGDSYVRLGQCVIDELPPNLPVRSGIAVTMHYDEQARVHITARDVVSGKSVSTQLVRAESIERREVPVDEDVTTRAASGPMVPAETPSPATMSASQAAPSAEARSAPASSPAARPLTAAAPSAAVTAPSAVVTPPTAKAKPPVRKPRVAEAAPLPERFSPHDLDEASEPIPLCNVCGEPLDARGRCRSCPPPPAAKKSAAAARPTSRKPAAVRPSAGVGSRPPSRRGSASTAGHAARPASTRKPAGEEIIELTEDAIVDMLSEEQDAGSPKRPAPPKPVAKKPSATGSKPKGRSKPPAAERDVDPGEEEFWRLSD